MNINRKTLVCTLLAGAMVLTSVTGADLAADQGQKVNAASVAPVTVNAAITGEIPGKRDKFTRQFAMSDGSYTAVTYSMPVHYKKGGNWNEIDTTLVKSGRKNYKTKATDLSIRVSAKADKKSVISMKRGKSGLSVALKGKKVKSAKAKISNPGKKAVTDVLNQNKVTYKRVMKKTNVSYDIFPEKVQEIVSIQKKQKSKAFSFSVVRQIRCTSSMQIRCA